MSVRVARWRDRWNLAIRPKRLLTMLRCLGPLHRGSTVVIVNWNSLEYLQTSIGAVRRFSPRGTRILVVDNGSEDGSVAWLRAQRDEAGIGQGQRDLVVVPLGHNVGHWPALDIGFLRARSRTVVALDVDAFPIASSWLDTLTTALDGGARVAGARGGWVLDQLVPDLQPGWEHRDLVHPCCCAMRLRRFVWKGHTFRSNSACFQDVGQLISDAEQPRTWYLEPTSHHGPGPVGTVFGDLVYHNFYATRYRTTDDELIDGVTRGAAEDAWGHAVSTFLSAGALDQHDRQETVLEER